MFLTLKLDIFLKNKFHIVWKLKLSSYMINLKSSQFQKQTKGKYMYYTCP